MSLVIVNSGCANIASVQFAVERLGAAVTVSDNPDIIRAADRVIVPGVGSFDFAVGALQKKSLMNVIASLTQPVLGICLGMQALFDGSAEGKKQGLGLIEGTAEKFDPSAGLTIPHMGWNALHDVSDDPLLEDISDGDHVYFVHSYYLPKGSATIATCDYGQKFSAIVRLDNFWGCQFHPERSGEIGAKILNNFMRLP